ncbi:MAG: hypothetical protein AAFQ73_17500, partial [Pseudomonadota bacterium]
AFSAEMLAVYLIRQFSLDLVQHVGQGTLDRSLARHIGVGNATGLGMAPFLVTHPVLLNNWMVARETALARVRAVPDISSDTCARARQLADRVAGHLSEWHVPSTTDEAALRALEAEWGAFRHHLVDLPDDDPYEDIWSRAQNGSTALQELVVAYLLELNGDIVDDLAERMVDPFGPRPQPFAGTDA